MGTGRWSERDWREYSQRNISGRERVEDIYTSRSLNPELDSRGITYRESCDSIDNPNATPIIIGLDVTGSMGFILDNMARVGLRNLATEIMNLNQTKVYEILMNIKNHYVTERLKELRVNNIDNEFKSILENNNLIFNFIEDIKKFIKNIKIISFKEINRNFTTLIFEGAQGLMLHENYKYFPHVTHSKTGIENVIEILNEVYSEFSNEVKNKVNIEVIYITRSYLTRHGAGPLPGELNCAPYNKIVDLTNIPNRFQGCLRFALLDLDLLNENIYNDFSKAINSGYNIRKSLAITCLDQIDTSAKYILKKEFKEDNISNFIDDIINKINPYKCYLSSGASREKIQIK